MLADYGTTGLTVARPSAGAAARPAARATPRRSRDLETLAHGTSGPDRRPGRGPPAARARPTAIVFILLEDEFGTINLIVPPQIYERHRLTVRTEPLMLVEGKLERFAAAGGAINVLVDRVGSIAAPDRLLAEVKDFSMLDEQVRAVGPSSGRQATAAGGQAPRHARRRSRGLPRRRAAGDELRVRAAPMNSSGPRSPAPARSVGPTHQLIRCVARYGAARRAPVLCSSPSGSARARPVLHRRPRRARAARGRRSSPRPGEAARWPASTFAVVYVGFGIALPIALLTGNHDNASGQVGGIKLTAAREARPRAVRRALRRLPHAGGAPTRSARSGPNLDTLKPPRRWCCTRSTTAACQNARPSSAWISAHACLVVQGRMPERGQLRGQVAGKAARTAAGRLCRRGQGRRQRVAPGAGIQLADRPRVRSRWYIAAPYS